MLFAIFTGIILSALPVDTPMAIAALSFLLVGKAFVDIRFDKVPFTDRPSPFLIYCYNLEKRGEQSGHAPFSYVMQLMVFGLLLGGCLIALIRYFTVSA